MLRLGWPMMVSAILDTSYQLVDTLWLGRLPGDEGGNAVAGLQISFTFIWFSAAFIIGFAMAGTALVSQYTGADRKANADFAAGQVLSISGISGFVIAVLGIASISHIAPLITNLRPLSVAASNYLRIYFIGLPLLFLTGVSRALLSASGNTITPMKIALFTNVINLIIDPVFIFGIGPISRMGIAGAGTATVISVSFSAVLSMHILLKGQRGVSLKWAYFIPKMDWIRKTFKIGFPASLASCAESLGFIFLLTIIGWLPEARQSLGGFGVGIRIINSAYFIMLGLAQGLTVIIGQSLGAGNIQRAQYAARFGIYVLFLTLLVFISLFISFRGSIIWLFVPSEPDMIREGSKYILFAGITVPLLGIVQGVNSAFNAAGFNIPTMIISFCRLWVFRLPLCYVLAFIIGLGSNGVWYGMGLSNLFTAMVAIGFFLQGRWKKSVIEEHDNQYLNDQ